MSASTCDFDALARELATLMAAYGEAQARCSDLIAQQAAQIAQLQAQTMQLRGALMARDSALAWAREDHRTLERRIPDLPARVALSNRIEALTARLRTLMRSRSETGFHAATNIDTVNTVDTIEVADGGNIAQLEASLVAADLVICQTGCVGHGDYWRVEDYCKRTGKPCVIVNQPAQVRVVRLQPCMESIAKPCAEPSGER